MFGDFLPIRSDVVCVGGDGRAFTDDFEKIFPLFQFKYFNISLPLCFIYV